MIDQPINQMTHPSAESKPKVPKWTDEDNTLCYDMLLQSKTITEIALTLGRSEAGIIKKRQIMIHDKVTAGERTKDEMMQIFGLNIQDIDQIINLEQKSQLSNKYNLMSLEQKKIRRQDRKVKLDAMRKAKGKGKYKNVDQPSGKKKM
jgi:hypothetical protein